MSREMNRLKKLFLCFWLCFPLTAVSAQYRFDRWTTDSGLPQNSVRAVSHTKDGYLWLGTFEGLARFDGANFTNFDNINTPEIKSNFIAALLEDSRNNLWIGIEGGGLVKRAGNHFTYFSKSDGLVDDGLICLFEDRAGNIWAGTVEGISVFGRDGKIVNRTTADGLPNNRVEDFAEDDAGNMWIATDNGLACLKNGKITVLTENDGLPSNSVKTLLWNAAEGLWIGTANGLVRLKDGKFFGFGADIEKSLGIVRKLCEDGRGNLWIGSENKGLFRFKAGEMNAPAAVGEVDEKNISAIYADAENNLWVGGWLGGLYRYREKRFRPFFKPGGAPEEEFTKAIYEDRTGALWYSTNDKLKRFKDGALTEFDLLKIGFISVTAIAEDAEGNLWFGGTPGISRYDGNRFSALTAKDGLIPGSVYAMLGDRAGSLFVGTSQGLSVYRDGQFTNYTTADGLVDNFVLSLYEDRAGSVWIGTRNGISRFTNGRFTNWTTDETAAGTQVISFYEDGGGAMWIGTSGGGLKRYKDGVFTTITSREGLYDNLAFQILEDRRGDLWMCGNKGVYRASLAELNDFADGRRASVNSYNYGTADGLPSRECNGASPAGWKTHDGQIWFPTVKGLAAVDENQSNLQPSAVIIEQVRLDNRVLDENSSIEIKPGEDSLEIQYTGINWIRPREIRFRYKLENLDQDWIEAGTRRTAYFPHLPPGYYVFTVVADNGDGVWNAAGKTLSIKVLPPFYRTWWFIGLCVLFAAGIGYFLYRRRIAQLERAGLVQQDFSRRLMSAHESERRRIAAELHDSIGQSLAMIKNRAVLGVELVTEEAAREQLDLIGAQTARTISEVREISYNLRPHLLDQLGLKRSLNSLLRQFVESEKIEIYSEVEDVDALFDKEAELSIYRIVQESLSNVVKHAAASEIEIYVKKSERIFSIIIIDNGNGFDLHAVGRTENSKNGGFGLFGIGERVRMLGGTHEIESETGAGTSIFIRIPLPDKTRK